MLRCPNCSYMLVLLEKRRKYKCAKCGNLYLQKDIELKDFKEWNLRQRISDKENIKSKRKKLTEDEKDKKAQEYRERNKYIIRQKNRGNWYNGNRKQYLKEHYRRDIEHSRLIKRIRYWRQQQKKLAIKEIDRFLRY